MRLPILFLLLAVSGLTAQEAVDFEGWLNQGIRALQKEDYTQAAESFQRAIQILPDNVTARLYLGSAYMHRVIPGTPTPEKAALASRATEQFLRVISLEPKNRVALAALGSISLNQRKWDEAQKWYDILVAADSSNVEATWA